MKQFSKYCIDRAKDNLQTVVYLKFKKILNLNEQWLPKELERIAQFQYFLSFASPSPHTMLIYFEIWVQSLRTGVRFVLPNVLSSKSNIVPGEGGYRFHLRGDLLTGTLKG